MTDREFADKSLTLSFEFDRFLASHPEIAQKIPEGVSVIFEIKNDPEFTSREKLLAKELKKNGEAFIIVRVEKVLPPFETRLVNPQLESVTA